MRTKILNAIRLSKGMTIEELADKTGIPVGTLAKICSGHTNTSYDKMTLIANALQCSLDEFSEVGVPAISQQELNWFEKYRKLSDHSKRMINSLIDLEMHLTTQAVNVQEKLLSVWVPVAYMEDGMNYDTCHIRHLKVKNSLAMKDIDFGWQITSNAFMPVYFEGDILLISHRFPKPGEAGLFMVDNVMYIKKYVMAKGQMRFCAVNMESKFADISNEQLSFQLCAGTICGVFRGEILTEYKDKEGKFPLEGVS